LLYHEPQQRGVDGDQQKHGADNQQGRVHARSEASLGIESLLIPGVASMRPVSPA
jgi:hypothetical protein